MDVRTVLEPDAIPSIDDPQFGNEHVGTGDDAVMVLEGSPPKAYPIRILNFHEIVNDEIDGDPVSVTWCPLCASAIVYERTVDGRVLTFGVSGKLADDDLVMYDRETESEWKQSLGRCIAGQLEGERLTVRPSTRMTWERFREEYPGGVVLQPASMPSEAASETEDPAPVEYEDDPYREYFESDGFGLGAHRAGEGRTWDREDLHPKTEVLGLDFGDVAVGYPKPRILAADGVITDSVAERDVVVFATPEGMTAYEHPGFAFEPMEDDTFVGDGTEWEPLTGESRDGRSLKPLPVRRLFAFTWQDDHGADAFYDP